MCRSKSSKNKGTLEETKQNAEGFILRKITLTPTSIIEEGVS